MRLPIAPIPTNPRLTWLAVNDFMLSPDIFKLLSGRRVDFVGGHQLCVRHLSSEFHLSLSRLFLRLGNECQQVLTIEPLTQILQIRSKRDRVAHQQTV